MGQITLTKVRKAFGEAEVIPGIDLDINDGEFVVFVGPSGCGKSTLLRLIAGLEDTTSGVIAIDGTDATSLPPAKRGLAMVFQSYALYPHMTVRKNIAFPLKMATLTDPKFKGAMESQAFFLNIYMLLSPPMPFALMPFLSVAFVNVCHAYAGKLAGLPLIGSRVVYFTTAEGTFQAQAFGAVSEVIVTFMTPMLIVVQGYRAGLLAFFFQYVARRYKSNPQTKQTVGLLVERIDGIAAHRFVPGGVRTIYGKVKGLVAAGAERFGS